jgi:hypothetical protein
MNDKILEQQPTWRYCKVRAGEKKPYPDNWQNTPLTLDQVDSSNIGLILGPKGNGVCTIDFDGTTAWTWAEEHGINISELTSIAWTSGKTDRCQMAFSVPEEYWDVLKTKKIVTKPASYVGAKDSEGFEFRWAGGQSVLPPSIHPDTKQSYFWLISADNELQTIPESILLAWLEEVAKEIPRELDLTPEVSIEELTDTDIQEVDSALNILKQRRPGLLYDEWRTIAWAVAHHIGRPAARALITKYYPEQKAGEYDALFKTWNKAKSPKIGSLMFMAGIKKETTPVDKYFDLQKKMKEKYGV